MDDFLRRLDSIVENGGETHRSLKAKTLAKSKTFTKGPLLEDVSISHAESEQLDYTLREQSMTKNKQANYRSLRPDHVSSFDAV
jgi:hypothetical protein